MNSIYFRVASVTSLFMAAAALAALDSQLWAQDRQSPSDMMATRLRCEYLTNPLGIDAPAPRLSWGVTAGGRGRMQSAYQILVASSPQLLDSLEGDLWDTGKVESQATAGIAYGGAPLVSQQTCFWKVRVWDELGRASRWSAAARWSMGLLRPEDWKAEWISRRDTSSLHSDRGTLHLPPASHYRRAFTADRQIKRAVVYASALGCYELHINGQRVGDSWFTPGWSDYRHRVYYNVFDVTSLLERGQNAIGAIVADGWYAGYVGYGLLVGYGPNKVGRYFYGKTPALLVQMEIEYRDGRRETLCSDTSWEVSNDGPIREADILMGESFDARKHRPDWCHPTGAPDWQWSAVIRAADNGSVKAVYSDTLGEREVELGFIKPPIMQSYGAPPIRLTEQIPAVKLTEPEPGKYIFDLGQNFAGVARVRLRGSAGTRVQIRHGEMLHPDGRLMTENLRRARATDHYILRGDTEGETWQPRFTYHGFQYVELSGLPSKPHLEDVTGLVLHNDTPLVGKFACSDELLTSFWKNTQWTQRANFFEVPTDCPQRDERLGWMGDAQVYARAASYNADVAAFFTKWLDDVEEAQREFGAYPDYCPYPMAHGKPGQTYGTAWTDAGIICPWTMWQVYGDRRVIERHWDSMMEFMSWRLERAPDLRGVNEGNTWGDWLNVGEPTPIEYVDICYHALDCHLMQQMATAIGKSQAAAQFARRLADIQEVFQREYLRDDATLTVDTQTAYVLALSCQLLPQQAVAGAADRLAQKIAENGYRMTTGFLGTKPLLPVLTQHGHHDLAVRLFQSRKFPSWGYEVVNGATTVWERWDSYTKQDGFGRHNAAMNSFSHYAFGAVTEWMFRNLAGIDTDEPGFQHILICPRPPSPGSNPDEPPVDWVRAEYDSIRGKIVSHWRREGDRFALRVTIPANTQATVLMPTRATGSITEGGRSLDDVPDVQTLGLDGDQTRISIGSGTYKFDAVIDGAQAE
jgi:alpha-L-rhamnosidase